MEEGGILGVIRVLILRSAFPPCSFLLSRVTPPQVTQCMDTSASATEIPVQDDQVSASTSGTSTSSSSTSTIPTLPNGWGKPSSDSMTGMILALSLSLAIVLIIFMMGIVLWRKKRRKYHDRDAEKTASVRGDADSEVSEEVKRARSQQRMWARASAKWLANVRQSARLRRKRKVVAKGSDSTLLNDGGTPRASTSAVSLARTSTTTGRPSTSIARPRSIRSRTVTRSRSPSPAPSSQSRQDDNDETQSPPPHPPAYPSELPSHRPHAYRSSSYHSDVPRRRYSHTSLFSEPPPPCSATHSRPPSPLPYEPPINSAHVATDDKNILAHMARLASAPPRADGPSPSSPGGSSELYPSVPILEDDGFEPLPPELRSDVDVHISVGRAIRGPSPSGVTPDTPPPPLDASSHYPGTDLPSNAIDSDVPSYTEDALRHPALVLPPPPSKIALAGPMFYEYPNEFEEDVATTEPPLGPSSPPFEEAPSAPPFQLDEDPSTAAPSAPPLDFADLPPPALEMPAPSAPPLGIDEDEPGHPPVHGTTSDSSGVDERALHAVPDDHGGVTARPAATGGGASVHQASTYSGRDRSQSPPGYLP